MTKKQAYLYQLKPARPDMLATGLTAEEERAVSIHSDYLDALAQQDVVVFFGRTLNTDSSAFGIVVFYAGSESKAIEIMQNDPAVQLGVMRARMFPFRIVYPEMG